MLADVVRKRRLQAIVAAIMVGVAVLAVAPPANADSTYLAGDITEDTWVYYGTPRWQSNPENLDEFQQVDAEGGQLTLGLSDSQGYQFAQSAAYGNDWTIIYNLNGNVWNPNYEFFIDAYVDTQCGGSGCGTFTWTANFQYNIPYNG